MLHPKGPRVLVKRIDDKLTSSVLQVITYDDSPSQFAIVLAVGDGYKKPDGSYIPLDVQAGDTVVTKKFSGAPFTVDFEGAEIEAFLLMDDDILAVLED